MLASAWALATWAATCLALAALGTALARRYALRRRLIDQPGERRSHAVATPRGGGIAIVLVMLVTLLLAASFDSFHSRLMIAAAIGLALVALVGWIDDHRPLSAPLRLAAHAVAAALLAHEVWLITDALAPALAAFALTVVLVNAWNFMDGINGLAASQAAVAAAGYALLADDAITRWLCVALAAACVGFLPFNFPRARIFLGDVGSGALGFTVSLLAVTIGIEHGGARGVVGIGAALVLLPLSAFLVDAGLTLLQRILRKERWWTPHVQHAYQRWAAAVRDHRRVTLAYFGWTCMGIAVMAATWGLDDPGIIAAVSAWYLGGGIAWVWLQSRHRQVNEEGQA